MLIALTEDGLMCMLEKPAEVTESKDGRYLYGLCDVAGHRKGFKWGLCGWRMGMFGMA